MAAVILGLMFSSTVSRATTFNWVAAPAFPTGVPSTNGATTSVDYWAATGNPISVTIGNTGGGTMTAGFPQVSQNVLSNGGVSNGLIIRTSAEPTVSSYISVTINFMYTAGATGVSFSLWDVDATVSGGTGFIDTIANIQGKTPGGATVFATANNTHTSNPGISYNIISGTQNTASLTISGDPAQAAGAANLTDQGQVNLSFSTAVSSITFNYYNTAATSRTTQTLGIGPITFTGGGTPFPEVNSSGAALMLCGGVLGFGLVRRRRNADRSPCESHA